MGTSRGWDALLLQWIGSVIRPTIITVAEHYFHPWQCGMVRDAAHHLESAAHGQLDGGHVMYTLFGASPGRLRWWPSPD